MLASDWSRGPSENFQRGYPYDPDILTSVTGRGHSIRITLGGITESEFQGGGITKLLNPMEISMKYIGNTVEIQ